MIKYCIEEKRYKEVIALWKPFSIFLWETGRWDLLDEFGEEIVSICIITHDSASAALLLIRERSWFYFWRGDSIVAKEKVMKGLQIAERLQDAYLLAFAKQRLGVLLTKEGQIERAKEHLHEALQVFTEMENHSHIADTYLYLGHAAKAERNVIAGLKYYFKSLNMAKKIGDSKAETTADSYLGNLFLESGDLSSAEKFHSSALETDKDIDNKAGMAFNLLGLAKVKAKQLKSGESEMLLTNAKELCLKLELMYLMPEIQKLEGKI